MRFDRFPGHVRIDFLKYYTTLKEHVKNVFRLKSQKQIERSALAPKIDVLIKKKKKKSVPPFIFRSIVLLLWH